MPSSNVIPTFKPSENSNHFIGVKNPPPKGHQGMRESGFRPDWPYHLCLVDQTNKLRYYPCTANAYAKVLKHQFFRKFDVEFRVTWAADRTITDINLVESRSSDDEEVQYDILISVGSDGGVVLEDLPNADMDKVDDVMKWFEENKEKRIRAGQRVCGFRITKITDDGDAKYYLEV